MKWSKTAKEVYDTGFTNKVMKDRDGNVTLFNMDLIQNDAPGSGSSEKGIFWDPVFGKNRARKILNLDDPRTNKAFVIVFSHHDAESTSGSAGGVGKFPLKFTVNGGPITVFDTGRPIAQYRWVEFPVNSLKKGKNIFEFFCPEAKSETECAELFLARADEFEHGGGDPADVGKTSFKSTDGGETWKESPFGPLGQTRAEYSIRLSLDRFVKTGWLATPVIDLWRIESDGFIVPNRTLTRMQQKKHTVEITLQSEVPEGTSVEYYLRKGVDPSPYSEKWGPYELAAQGPNPKIEILGENIQNRYIQIKAVMSTTNPLKSPIIKSINIEAKLTEFLGVPENLKVVSVDNLPIQYSSINWEWEPSNRPELKEVRERECLDEVVAGCKTEFQAQVKILHYATMRFNYLHPRIDYPEWTAKSVLERVDREGTGGMCIQYNNLLMGLLLSFGWQTRLITIPGHEVCEVWSDDFRKWVYMDASHVNQYIYLNDTLIPQNILENHFTYLETFPPKGPINWMNYNNLQKFDPEKLPTMRGSLTHHEPVQGANSNANQPLFLRTLPRNNYYEKPTPMPLTHGMTWWPWDGYINWYDEKTPPMRHYSWHTDRPRDMYPDLNTVHVHATTAFGNEMVYLHFETYTPNISHFEVDCDESGWKKSGEKYTWFLVSGENTLRVRPVNKLGVKGKPSAITLRYVDLRQREFEKISY
ncbi:MAG: transglutaminase-like domain-containing protein [Candidatus Latescibacter sp.]|nr:transglutaminase-like domain-containing protein [Candidatus Latescibacter sp.]